MKIFLALYLLCVASTVYRLVKYRASTSEWLRRREMLPDRPEWFYHTVWAGVLVIGIFFAPYFTIRRLFS